MACDNSLWCHWGVCRSSLCLSSTRFIKIVPQNSIKNIPTYLYLCSSIRYDYNSKNLYVNSSPPSAACMCQTVSIVSGNGLLPFQHQAISSVPEPCWLKINWTLRNNPVKFISPCYLIHLFITVHKIWIELNWNWKKMNWIGIELKDSESDLNWNWIELKNPESNLNWNWIELKEMNWSEPCLEVVFAQSFEARC